MIIEFTDSEYGVIVDSLALTRDRIRDEGNATPTIDAALAKLSKWATPTGCQFLAVTGEDAALIGAVTVPGVTA